ncbi:MAG: general secretion pathway protein GspK [Acidobacteria bacterium]|nr:general secretion pathway protein GspK [Acidobacteriota bacterium]
MCRCNREGSILVVMLWMLMVVSVLCISFSKTMRVEAQTSANTLLITKCHYLAQAGVAETIYKLIVYTLETSDRLFNPQQQAEIEPLDIEKGKVILHTDLGDAETDITDENGKIHLNYADKELLMSLLLSLGVAEQKADMISDCILDWRDPDDDHHLNGAETPEYQAMGRNYRVKNAEFETVEELLLVKGINKNLFYGRYVRGQGGKPAYMYGLNSCLTVYGTPAGINVNSAPLPVLIALGFPPEMAASIISQRTTKPFRDQQDFALRVPQAPGMDQLKAPIITRSPIQSSFFSLVSTGKLKDSTIRKRIYCVVKLDAGAPLRHSIVYWNENYSVQEQVEK